MLSKEMTYANYSFKRVAVSIFILSFFLYGSTIFNDYGFDDELVTTESNPIIFNKISKGIRGIPNIFKSRYSEAGGQAYGYRPFVQTTFAIEYQLFGLNPHVSHFINVLLYSASCILLFYLLTQLFASYSVIFPLLIVFLFIIHPIHTEVVNNIKSRDSLLCFLGAVLLMISLHKYGNTGKLKYLLFAILSYTFALWSKETVKAFMLLAPIMIFFFHKTNWKRILVVFFSMLGITYVLGMTRNYLLKDTVLAVREYIFFENPLFFESIFVNKLPLAFYSLAYYIKLHLLPHPLSFYYGYNQIPKVGWDNWVVWLSLLFYMAIGIFALIKLPKKHVLSFSIFYFLLTIFGFSNLIFPIVGIVGERYVYFCSLGFCIVLAYLLLKFFKIPFTSEKELKLSFNGLKKSFRYTLVIILCLSSIKILSRNLDWKDRLTLFQNDIEHTQKSAKAHLLLANALCTKVDKEKLSNAEQNKLLHQAIGHYERAIEIYPEYIFAYNSLAFLYSTFYRNADKAMEWFEKAYEKDSTNNMTLFNIASMQLMSNKIDEAQLNFEKTLKLDSNNLQAYSRLSSVYLRNKDTTKALLLNKAGLKFFPKEPQLLINVGTLYHLKKDTVRSLNYLAKALEVDPGNSKMRSFYNFISDKYSSNKRKKEALDTSE